MKALITSIIMAFAIMPSYADKQPETKRVCIQEKNAKTGKTKESLPPKKRKQSDLKPKELQDLQKVREMLTTIYEHSDILMRSAKTLGATNIREAFRIFEMKNWQSIIGSEFGVDFDIIKYLFESGRINENWVNILHKN
jgi:hypothetical protein